MKRNIKRIIFAACEGKSEQRYMKVLNLFADENKLDIQINSKDLEGGGYSKMAKKAISIDKKANENRKIAIKTILFDTDNLSDINRVTIEKTENNLRNADFIIIRQNPNHEAFLWRHFNGEGQTPPDAGKIKEDFEKFWPGYKKNYPADDLKKKIDLPKIIKVAHSLKNEGDDGFLDLLEKMGLLKG